MLKQKKPSLSRPVSLDRHGQRGLFNIFLYQALSETTLVP